MNRIGRPLAAGIAVCALIALAPITDGSIIWKCDLSGIPYESLFNLPYFNGHFYAETRGGKGSTSLARIGGDQIDDATTPQ